MSSGYRILKEQRKLYKEMGSDYVLPARYSEHNLCLSLDVGSTQKKMEKAPEGNGLKENVKRWIVCYVIKKEKSNITGIQYEPWDIRYVG